MEENPFDPMPSRWPPDGEPNPSVHRKGQHRHPERGLIYFVEAVGLDRIKIGFTTGTFQARLAVIQTGSPVEIRPLLVLKDETKAEEGAIHRIFRAQRTHGEWYILDGLIAKYLQVLVSTTPPERIVIWRDNVNWLITRKCVDLEAIQFDPGEVESRIGYHPNTD